MIDHLIDDEVSIGDYVLTNGAVAAAVFVDAVARLIPGVLGDENSAVEDSFAQGVLEGPQYTRPPDFRGWRVPDVLLSRKSRANREVARGAGDGEDAEGAAGFAGVTGGFKVRRV